MSKIVSTVVSEGMTYNSKYGAGVGSESKTASQAWDSDIQT